MPKLVLNSLTKLLIKFYHSRGKSDRWIAKKIGVSCTTVSHCINNNYPYKKGK